MAPKPETPETHILPLAGLNATAWVMCTACILLTAGRFLIRWNTIRRFNLDDIFNAAALLCLIGFMVTYQLFVPIQYNAQLYELKLGGYEPTVEQLQYELNVDVANICFFWTIIYLVKASFLALYHEVFSPFARFKAALWCVIGYTAISYLVTFLAIFWNCGSPSNVTNLEACATQPRSLYLTIEIMWVVLNVLGDIFIIILPLGVLRELQMPLGQKVGVGLIFAIVLVDITFDILRLMFSISAHFSNWPDANVMWVLMEPSVAVIVCTLPSYRKLVSWKGKSLFAWTHWLGLSKISSIKSSGHTSERSGSIDKQSQRTLNHTIPMEMDHTSGYSLNSHTDKSDDAGQYC